MKPFIVALVATYRRAPELARMLHSLNDVSLPLAVLVVDNADDPETEAVVREARCGFEISRLTPGANLGCGGGLAFGERAARERYGERFTHLWIMDDDVEVGPGTLERLVEAMATERAGLACPMVVWPDGKIGWAPGIEAPTRTRPFEKKETPSEYLARQGSAPRRVSWATGVSVLVTREAFEACGEHRDDFWIRGEDLDWTLRITARSPGIFVPDTLVWHYPKPIEESAEARAAEFRKHGALLQNVAYIATHLPHGRRILWTLPANLWRFARQWGFPGLAEGIRLYWLGLCGYPAGAKR